MHREVVMKKNGFTLIELLATLIILALVVGISIVGINVSMTNAKKNTEKVFIKSLKDAVESYIETSISEINRIGREGFSEICYIKKNNQEVEVTGNLINFTFRNVIDSDYSPLDQSKFFNPVNKTNCSLDAGISIYKDTDQVYYYKFDLKDLGCMEYNTEIVSVLPECTK